jgi:single-stranded-DNA-specific exonuclease
MEHANAAYDLLSTDSLADAAALAAGLQAANADRQAEVERISREAIAQVGQLDPSKKIVFAYAPGWSSGLVGLVASKLVQTYGRPAFALGFDGTRYVGSGRSLPGFDITAAMATMPQLLERYGGHAAACGCTVAPEQLPAFIAGMEALAASQLSNVDLTPSLNVDMELLLKDLTWDVLDQLVQFEPFGQANPKPLAVSRNLEVVELKPLGKDSTHLRMHVREAGQDIYKTISFGTANTWGKEIQIGQRIDLVYEPGVNQWNGNRELQLKVVDWKPSENKA